MDLIRITDLSKTYFPTSEALKKVSLVIKTGEMTGIVGPNGSGKTTLINCILGLLPYDKGTIIWKEKKSTDMIFIPDENLLPELLTGDEYINFLLKLYKKQKSDLVSSMMEAFEMKADQHKSISAYSYGMKKKIQIIAACAVMPQLIIMDEPFRGLDVEAIIVAKIFLKNYLKGGGTVLLSSHDIFAVEQLCESAIMIYTGEIKEQGKTLDIIKKYCTNSLEEVFIKLSGKDYNSYATKVYFDQ